MTVTLYKIRLLKPVQLADRTHEPGEIVEVSGGTWRGWIKAGIGRPVEVEEDPPLEAAAVELTGETPEADETAPKKRRKG